MKVTKEIKTILKILDKAVVREIMLYNTETATPFFDYMIVASASSSRQAKAAADYLKKDGELAGFKVRSSSGGQDAGWFLVDFDFVVIHIFVLEERQRYNLDGLYCHVEHVRIED